MMLTPRQLAFVEAFSIDGNAARAARAAGYAEGSAKVVACRLTKDNRIAAEIAKRRAANAHKLEITKEKVLLQLVEAINVARDQQNPVAMISGCSQLAKLCGFYDSTDRTQSLDPTEISRTVSQFRNMSDEKLIQIVLGESSS